MGGRPIPRMEEKASSPPTVHFAMALAVSAGGAGERKERPFVVVSGLPGSGKTTLARQLASSLALPLLDKDDFLERLFEAKGIGDAAWRRTLSRESDALFQAAAAESNGAILTSFWRLPGMSATSGTPTAWLRELSHHLVHVRCLSPVELASGRFFARKRHAGHLDPASYAETLASMRSQAALGPLDIEPAVNVDTSGGFSVDTLAHQVCVLLAGGRGQVDGCET